MNGLITELRKANVNKEYSTLRPPNVFAIAMWRLQVEKGIQHNMNTATVFNASFKKQNLMAK